MANLKVGNTTIGKIAVIEPYEDVYVDDTPTPITPWTRPSHWLDMPVINSGEDKCAFLFAVPSGDQYGDDSLLRYFAIKAYGERLSNNNYLTDCSINWGDGNVDYVNQSGGIPAMPIEHEFEFSSLSESTEFTDNGIRYRQAMIVVEANSGIYDFDFKYKKYHGSYSRNYPKQNILEFDINLPNAIGVTASHYNGFTQDMHLLKKARVYAPNANQFNALFDGSWNLEELDIYSGVMPNLTGVNFMFGRCGLKELPTIDVSNALDAKYMFHKMKNIKTLPSGLYNFGSLTGCQYTFFASSFEEIHFDIPSTLTRCESMFQTCRNLKKITGNWDLSNVWYAPSMFQDCNSLVYTPDFELSGIQSLNYLFYNCYSLKKIPDVIPTNCTSARSAFHSCRSIEEINLDLSNPNDNSIRYENLFNSCFSLRKVNLLNSSIYTTAVQGVQGMFSVCNSLEQLPYIDLSGVINTHGFVSSCTSLKRIGGINAPHATNMDYMFDACTSLEDIGESNFATEATSLTRAVRAFRSCSALKKFPVSDLSNFYACQDFFSNLNASGEIDVDFSSCITSNNPGSTNWFSNWNYGRTPFRIKSLTIPSGAKLDSMFYSNGNLVSIPYADASNIDSCSAMFNYATALEVGALSGVSKSIGYYRCPMASGATLDVINGLASGVAGQTIDLRQVPGVYALSSDQLSIATSKGWTVLT